MASPPKYQIKSNLSEKQIEADVASFFGWCTANEITAPFRLLDVNEQLTGADKLFDRATVIYIQFKKSSGLKSTLEIPTSNRKGRSPLEGIREYRADEGLCSDPTLYFQLREKAKTATDLQHNILYAYERPPSSRGIYVAPLILDKDKYYSTLFESSTRFLLHPFFYRFNYEIHERGLISQLGNVPFLKEHISIPPHQKVTDHNHYYAYSETGTDISWHSPKVIKRGSMRLSEFVVKLLKTTIIDSESMTSLEHAAKNAVEIGREFGFPDELKNTDALQALISHGRWLLENYDIRQFIVLAKSEDLAELRRQL